MPFNFLFLLCIILRDTKKMCPDIDFTDSESEGTFE